MTPTIHTRLLALLSLVLPGGVSAAEPYAWPAGLPRPVTLYHHASTLQEGSLRGFADLYSAQGEATANRAYAKYIAELARTRAIENRQAEVAAYHKLRQLNHEQRFGPSKERVAYVPVRRQPKRPTFEQFDRDGMMIHWPVTLLGEEFAADREALQQALSLRTGYNHGPGSEVHKTANQAGERMLAKLREQISGMTAIEYMASRRLIESLVWETRFAP